MLEWLSTGFRMDIGFIDYLYTQLGTASTYSASAITPHFTRQGMSLAAQELNWERRQSKVIEKKWKERN
jgi:hypothetical protein